MRVEVAVVNGDLRWNFEDPCEGEKILPDTEQELREVIERTVLSLEKQRINEICDKYGYNGLSDIQYYASQNDSEAQALLKFYGAYDDAIWNYIGSLQNKTKEELLQDVQILKTIEEQIYQSVIQNNPLP